MLSFKRLSLLLAGLLLTVFLAACSNPMSSSSSMSNTTSSNTTTGSKTTTQNTTGNTMNNYGNSTGMQKSTPTATTQNNNNMGTQKNNTMGSNTTTGSNTMGGSTMGGSTMSGNTMNALIRTTQVMLNGKMITVLTNAKGMILYYKTNDPVPDSNCTGACAQAWPPVLASGMNMTVTSSVQLPHQLTVHTTGNGAQVEYDGHPLYTYANDMAPGQFTGRGEGMVWYLVSTGL